MDSTIKTNDLYELQQAILDAIGMGDRNDVSEITINITPERWPTVRIVSTHEISEGLGKFGFYLSSKNYVLVPQDESSESDTFPTDQHE